MGQQKYSDEQLVAALDATKGMITLASKQSGISIDVFYDRMKISPAVKAAVRNAREQGLDLAELKLLEHINKGNVTALIFYLKTVGKERGYVERHEMDIRIIAAMPAFLEAAAQRGLNPGKLLESLTVEIQAVPVDVDTEV